MALYMITVCQNAMAKDAVLSYLGQKLSAYRVRTKTNTKTGAVEVRVKTCLEEMSTRYMNDIAAIPMVKQSILIRHCNPIYKKIKGIKIEKAY